MNRKKIYIITTCCGLAAIIIFEIVMYCFVGEDVLSEKGIMRTLWINFPIVILVLSFLRDFLIKKIYNDDK